MSENKLSDHIHAELLALQDLAVADIAFYKQQQWRICNYGLALYAAIVAVPKLIESQLSRHEYLALGVLAIGVLIAGIALIKDMGTSLAKGRDRLPALRKHFDREISLKAYAADGEPEIALLSSQDKVSLECFFYFILLVGCGLTIWLLIRFAYA